MSSNLKFFNTQASPPGPEEKENGDPDVNSQRPAAAEQTPAFAPLSKASLPITHALAQPASTEATWSAGITLAVVKRTTWQRAGTEAGRRLQ